MSRNTSDHELQFKVDSLLPLKTEATQVTDDVLMKIGDCILLDSLPYLLVHDRSTDNNQISCHLTSQLQAE